MGRPKLERGKATCHPDKKEWRDGLCRTCYQLQFRKTNSVKALCHPDRPHYSGGMCIKCYRQNWLLGVEAGWFDKNLESQGYKCGACGDVLDLSSRNGANIDHDHATGAIRGILCNGCNTGIGLFKDSPERLRRAAAYLESHGK